MSIEQSIAPFKIVYHEKSTSVIMSEVGTYKQPIFDERADEGFQGSGYDWQSLAEVFLEEKLPQLKDKIRMDSESSMFCAYSADKNALEEFAVKFHAACEDDAVMRDLFSRAELD